MRAVFVALVVTLAVGCNRSSPVTRTAPQQGDLLPLSTTQPFEGDVLCVYYQDFVSGDIYRVSLDGSVRELALSAGESHGIRLSLKAPAHAASWRVTVGGVPGGTGWTLVDEVAAPQKAWSPDRVTDSGLAYFALSDRVSDWRAVYALNDIERPPGLLDYGWTALSYVQGDRKVTYTFDGADPDGRSVALVDESHAIVFDLPEVVVWNLDTDERTNIANARNAFLWPRNLHDPERFIPVANTPPLEESPSEPTALPLGRVLTLLDRSQCAYYKDAKTNDFFRVSLDGTVRERVLRGGPSGMVQLAPTRPTAKGQGRIHVSCVPGGNGYTVLDVTAARATIADFDTTSTSGTAHFANTDRLSAWTIDFVTAKHAIEPGHFHSSWDSVVFSKGTKKATYRYSGMDSSLQRVWLIDDSHALVFDRPSVIVWNLQTDVRTTIALASQVVLFPRDLHKRERFVPVAKLGSKSWKLKNPDDVAVR